MLLVTGLRGLRGIGVHVSESNPTKRLAHVKRSKGGLEEKLEKAEALKGGHRSIEETCNNGMRDDR